MFMSRLRLLPTTLIVLGLVTLLAASLLIPRASDLVGWVGFAAAIVAISALALTLAVPVHWLPAMALVLFVALPRALVPADGILNAVPVLSMIMLIWLVRRVLAATTAGPIPGGRSVTKIAIQVSAALFVLWSLFASATSTESSTAFAWLTSFTIGALIPILVADARLEARLVRTAWIVCGGVMGAYAVVELALQRSPLYGSIYSALGVPSAQHWSVYRAEASFYHPLYAGAFLAVAATLGVGLWLRSGARWPLVFGGVSAVGVVATVSRGSIVATAVGIGVAVVAAIVIEGRKVALRLVVVTALGVVAVVGLLNFGALNDRSGSAEAELSGGARDTGLAVSLKAAAASNWLGSGPGTSGISARRFDDGVIENSALQLLISVGIPGLALISVLLAGLVINSLKSKDVASAAALVTYAVCITGFNAIDALRGMHLLIGLLVLLTLNPATGRAGPGRSQPSALALSNQFR